MNNLFKGAMLSINDSSILISVQFCNNSLFFFLVLRIRKRWKVNQEKLTKNKLNLVEIDIVDPNELLHEHLL